MQSTTVSTWQKFAEVTILTNDLDPSYEFLYKARSLKGEEWSERFIVHYLCFYDLGGAVACADKTTADTFWPYMFEGYSSFPRGTERRHTRGDGGLRFLQNLSLHGSPHSIWTTMWAPTYTELVKVFKDKFAGCGFGPYFIWKVLDFQERVWGRPISLSLAEAVKHCPDEPRKCAAILWPHLPFVEALEKVTYYIHRMPAPPSFNRPCSYQEAETVLCMLKGYFITKTHTIGDDIDSKYLQLHRWPELQELLPPQENWSKYERCTLVAS